MFSQWFWLLEPKPSLAAMLHEFKRDRFCFSHARHSICLGSFSLGMGQLAPYEVMKESRPHDVDLLLWAFSSVGLGPTDSWMSDPSGPL
eukprot:s853_g12.t1